MRLLFSLCNNSERMIRLLNHFTDKGFAISWSSNPQADTNQWVGNFSIEFFDSNAVPSKDEPACRSMQICMMNEQPDLELIKMLIMEEGQICETPEEADLIVCLETLISQTLSCYPRKIVVGEIELNIQINEEQHKYQLRPIGDPYNTTPPRLPDYLRPCWAKLRKRSIESIDEGLDLFSDAVSANNLAGDPLLDQVAVYEGRLSPGNRFLLNDQDTHPYSYYALLGILSRSPAGSRGEALRMGIKKLTCRYNDNNEFLDVIALPEIKGFERLNELELRICEAIGPTSSSQLSQRWHRLSQLSRLSITSEVEINVDFIDAPLLKELVLRGGGFSGIEGVRKCLLLEKIDISETAIIDLEPLSELSRSCRDIDLSNTKVSSLAPLASYTQLENLQISYCGKLKSFRGLSQVSLKKNYFRIRYSGITSLVDLPVIEGTGAFFEFIPTVDLKGLANSINLKKLELKQMELLENIEELLSLPYLEELTLSDCNLLLNFELLEHLPLLRKVDISFTDLTTVVLPAKWPDTLQQLNLYNLNVSQLGDLPVNFEGALDLTGINKLTNFDNLAGCTKIHTIKLTHSFIENITSLTPLAQLDGLWIYIDMENQSCFSDSVITALLDLPACRLGLINYNSINLSSLAKLSNLKALDLDNITINDLIPIVGMPELEYLHFPPGSLPELGGCTFNTVSKIAKLKMQLMIL